MDLRLGLSHVVLLDLGLTILWLVALSNAFNLLDNMDGLAAGIAAIALGFRWLFLAGPGNSEAAIMVVALLGACLGFLVFNFAPAQKPDPKGLSEPAKEPKPDLRNRDHLKRRGRR